MEELDDIDRAILTILQEDGRISQAELAQRIGMAPPSALRRMRLLEERGYIRGYAALIDPLKVGLTVTGFVFLESTPGSDLDALCTFLMRQDGVQEVHRLIGEWCFLLKVRTTSPQALEDVLYRQLRRHPDIRRTQTTLSTSSAYETPAVSIPAASPRQESPVRS